MQTLNALGISVVAFIFVLGVLIFIHELGHHLVAKFLGIRVEIFSLGFGSRLFGFRKGDTDYRVSLIPLGGYVKMAGENPDEELSGSPEEFLSRPKLHRFAVAVAGPVMNLGLALLLLTVFFMSGMPVAVYKSDPPVIGAVQFESPAEEVGLKENDLILSINGDPVATWDEAEFRIGTSPNLLLILEIERDGQKLRREVVSKATERFGTGYIGIAPFVPYRVSKVEPESAAAEAGLRSGDEILSVRTSDSTYLGFYKIAEVVSTSGGQALTFEVRREGEVLEKTITPRMTDGRYLIGAFNYFETEVQQFGPLASLQKSIRENYRLAELTFATVWRIISGKASIKHMSGPIEIARFSGIAASQGWVYLFSFMGLVSLQLGLLNLLPIPILDGGVITLLAIEGILGRDLSLKVKERIFQVGFLFLVLLMGVVIFNDITKNLPDF